MWLSCLKDWWHNHRISTCSKLSLMSISCFSTMTAESWRKKIKKQNHSRVNEQTTHVFLAWPSLKHIWPTRAADWSPRHWGDKLTVRRPWQSLSQEFDDHIWRINAKTFASISHYIWYLYFFSSLISVSVRLYWTRQLKSKVIQIITWAADF